MTAYVYRAAHASGRVQKGRMEAANENELAAVLRQLDLELIEARVQKERWRLSLPERLTPQERAALCGQMEDLLRAGLPFAEALDLVLETRPSGLLQTRLLLIAGAVRAGASVQAAFAAQTPLFDPVFLAILESGERSGDLAGTFGLLAKQLRWQDQMRRDLSRALRYPLFLLCVAIGVTSFMMAYVVPEIVSFLLGIGATLPFLTRLLIGSASFFAALWWLFPALVLFSGLFLRLARRGSPSLAEKTDEWTLLLPGIGPVLRQLALARMATSFTLLLKSGLPLPAALNVAAGTLGNRFLAARAAQANAALESGRSLSQATGDLFPALVLQMIKVGEKSGALPKALDEVARLYEREAHEAVERFIGALEPALTLFVGGLLAWIVLAVLGPVYGALGTFSGGV